MGRLSCAYYTHGALPAHVADVDGSSRYVPWLSPGNLDAGMALVVYVALLNTENCF